MATIELTPDRLRVRLSTPERLGGLLRDLDIPRSAIRSAEAVPSGIRAVRGIRAPGLAVPGWVKIGTWRRRGHRSFVVARRGPAVRLLLEGQHYDTIVVDSEDAADTVAALR